jgi:flagellar capping protein FliD
MVKVQR